MDLKNKTVIVTGASSGIGAATAQLFAAEGANVVLGARRLPELKSVVENITANGGKAIALAGDVREEPYAYQLVDTAVTHFGGLDGAFNNAGIVGQLCPAPEMPTENWNTVIETNLTSAFFAAKAQIPALQARGGGSIVFTSSFVGHSNGGMPGMGAYAASKAGLVGFSQSLAIEYAANEIRVSALLPGGIKTPMAGDDEEAHAFIANLHPIKRLGRSEEIAQAALFLISNRSTFMTGSPMIVDGGMSVRLL